jgi:hypothetical protein
MTRLLRCLLPLILPLAAKWAAEEENRILFAGVPLNESQLSDARILGVKYPERIRILQVSTIPLPKNPFLSVAGRAAGILSCTGSVEIHFGPGRPGIQSKTPRRIQVMTLDSLRLLESGLGDTNDVAIGFLAKPFMDRIRSSQASTGTEALDSADPHENFRII